MLCLNFVKVQFKVSNKQKANESQLKLFRAFCKCGNHSEQLKPMKPLLAVLSSRLFLTQNIQKS